MPLQNLTGEPLFLLVVVISGLLYIPLNRRKSKYYWGSVVDRKIPLVPIFIIPYLYFFFPYMIFGFLFLLGNTAAIPFLKSFVIANIVADVIWYFFPNGVRRPKVSGAGFWRNMIKSLYKTDKYDTNGFPSSHVYYTSIISWYLISILPQYSPLFLFIGILIVISTLFTKQHYLVDVFGGLALSLVSIYIANAFWGW